MLPAEARTPLPPASPETSGAQGQWREPVAQDPGGDMPLTRAPQTGHGREPLGADSTRQGGRPREQLASPAPG